MVTNCNGIVYIFVHFNRKIEEVMWCSEEIDKLAIKILQSWAQFCGHTWDPFSLLPSGDGHLISCHFLFMGGHQVSRSLSGLVSSGGRIRFKIHTKNPIWTPGGWKGELCRSA